MHDAAPPRPPYTLEHVSTRLYALHLDLAKRHAEAGGISASEYFRRAIQRQLAEDESDPTIAIPYGEVEHEIEREAARRGMSVVDYMRAVTREQLAKQAAPTKRKARS